MLLGCGIFFSLRSQCYLLFLLWMIYKNPWALRYCYGAGGRKWSSSGVSRTFIRFSAPSVSPQHDQGCGHHSTQVYMRHHRWRTWLRPRPRGLVWQKERGNNSERKREVSHPAGGWSRINLPTASIIASLLFSSHTGGTVWKDKLIRGPASTGWPVPV